jgi:hypothetical protein
MNPDSRLIIVDCVVPESNEPHFAKFIDLNMLVMTGGKERTQDEFAKLFEAAGFKLLRVIPTEQPTSIIEGQPFERARSVFPLCFINIRPKINLCAFSASSASRR